ncbi:peroxidase 29 [Camellia sinensis]|uniref:peroxidase 29 n=1 Tax=Camellia sinensis TaxID=4442 RepID=UPI0010359943|nr:peroxidase 29 [Camellia sinensis]
MGLRSIFGVIILVLSLWFKVEGGGWLSYDFYERTCPQVEGIVRAGLQSLYLSDPTSPAALLRLMFHDCQVQGCDASILLDSTNFTIKSEIASPKNFGIRNRESISVIKSMVEAVCPQQVSCADILILAAREAVAIAGGPWIQVPLGRRDSMSPNYTLADAVLPTLNIGVDHMLRNFSKTGMSIEESVAIMGAHTLGITHCKNILDRLYNSSDANYNTMDTELKKMLRLICRLRSSTANISFVINDPTACIFDNQYYINVMKRRGILSIDSDLLSDPRTVPFVQRFADDQGGFFQAFSSAFVKLSSSGVLTGDQGVIRRICSAVQ